MKFVRQMLMAVVLWIWPATLAGTLVAVLVAMPTLAWRWPWFVWLPLAPLLYIGWLVLFLAVCGRGMRRVHARHPRPRYAMTPGGAAKFLAVGLSSGRRQVVSSLPLVPLLQQTTWGRRLVMQAYAPSVHIGRDVRIVGQVSDPDLTEIGDGAVIGAEVLIAGHAWTALSNGRFVYVSSPIKIGTRVTVGAGTLVQYGCVIGDDALIEPMSYLPPSTEVPPGEIWGGRPATFRGKRTPLRKSGEGADRSD